MKDVWVEKYRPKTLDEVVGQSEITERLTAYAEVKSLPHLLFAGPAGTGKTTCAIALARELFGDDWKENFQELNASDERGIDVVRTKIKEYARIAPIGEAGFKIIFLDEADALTSDAQAALRRTMEKYTQTCRFILSCNYSSKIIEPIQSRCAVFRFRPLKADDVKTYLFRILASEGKEITDEGMEALVYIASGDCRKATNSLQVAASMGDQIDTNMIYKTSSLARPEEIKKLLSTALSGNFIEAREQLDTLLINYGLSGEDVIWQVHRSIVDLPIHDRLKVELVEKVGEIEFRIVEGGNERIQLEALLAQFLLAGEKKDTQAFK
ncbi:MAG: replication factor C small subunit [Thermoplasmata archaeon]|nr:MAG: replication factor C small subunit [Thermoplasmata archaeon]